MKRNNAVGVKGKSGRKSKFVEERRDHLKNLCIEWAIDEMESAKSKNKKDIVLRVLQKVFPTEIGGAEGGPITIQMVSYADNKTTPSIHA